MPMLNNIADVEKYDEAGENIVAAIEQMSGTSARLDDMRRVSYPRPSAPPPHDEPGTIIWTRYALEALACAVLDLQKKAQPKAAATKKGK